MATLFDAVAYQQIVSRIDSLQPEAKREWGKMTAAQMLEHTARALDAACGHTQLQHAFLGKAIGWMFRKGFVGPKPFGKDLPTAPELIVQGEPDFDSTKDRVLTLLNQFHAMGEQGCEGNIHGFFGRMTGAEWGVTQYKHLDHHLRQFGV